MNKEIFAIYKPIGISPLDAIKRFKEKYPSQKNRKMTYAGRLDPMAEGVVLVIADKELKNFKKHLLYPKVYLAKIIFGFKTDSYDILGIPTQKKSPKIKTLKKEIFSFVGDSELELPPFSSYRVSGKPLFKWFLENRIKEIDLPTKTVRVNQIKVKKPKKIESALLLKLISNKLKKVEGNFRQKEILYQWEKLLKESNQKYITLELKIDAESGFYVRSLANELGKRAKSGAILVSLKRTKVGNFSLKRTIKI